MKKENNNMVYVLTTDYEGSQPDIIGLYLSKESAEVEMDSLLHDLLTDTMQGMTDITDTTLDMLKEDVVTHTDENWKQYIFGEDYITLSVMEIQP